MFKPKTESKEQEGREDSLMKCFMVWTFQHILLRSRMWWTDHV